MHMSKTPPVLTTPTPRSQAAKAFLQSGNEAPEQQQVEKVVVKKSVATDRKQKAAARYMAQHGITDVSTLEFTRINCDIPKQLHRWLNVHARSSDDVGSMTEIVLELLGQYAKERGFKPQ